MPRSFKKRHRVAVLFLLRGCYAAEMPRSKKQHRGAFFVVALRLLSGPKCRNATQQPKTHTHTHTHRPRRCLFAPRLLSCRNSTRGIAFLPPRTDKWGHVFLLLRGLPELLTHSLTHAGGTIGTPRLPSKKTTGRVYCLLRGLPEPLTHSCRRGRWDAAATQKKKHGGAGARILCCAVSGTDHSLTHSLTHRAKKNQGRLFVGQARLPNKKQHRFQFTAPKRERGKLTA